MKKLVLCLLALTPAFAFAAPGPYASVEAGVNWVVPDANWTGGPSNVSQNDATGIAGGAAAGYLWGNNTINYGLEVDALSYPDSNGSSQTVNGFPYGTKYDGYNLSLLGVLKYTSCSTGITAFVKGGAAYVDQQVSITGLHGNTINSTSNTNDFAPEAAVGVGYMLNPNLEVDVIADEVFAGSQKDINVASLANIQGAKTQTAENRNFLAALTYHFG